MDNSFEPARCRKCGDPYFEGAHYCGTQIKPIENGPLISLPSCSPEDDLARVLANLQERIRCLEEVNSNLRLALSVAQSNVRKAADLGAISERAKFMAWLSDAAKALPSNVNLSQGVFALVCRDLHYVLSEAIRVQSQIKAVAPISQDPVSVSDPEVAS